MIRSSRAGDIQFCCSGDANTAAMLFDARREAKVRHWRKQRFTGAVVMMMNKDLAFRRAFDSRVESKVRSIMRESALVERLSV